MGSPAYLAQAIDYLDQWLSYQKLLDPQTPGYSVAISHDDAIIYKQGFGLADIAANEAMTPDHLFRVASHSKTFTATAIMQLMQESRLNIHDPVSLYLPFVKRNPDPRMAEITLQQLLSHSSGMTRDGHEPSFWTLERPYPSRQELVDFWSTVPLTIEHNTRFKYSNYGYALLGLVVEHVSGLGFEEYICRNILEPLGLKKIGAKYNPEDGPYATGYTAITPMGDQHPIPAGLNTRSLASATGFYACAESLCKFYSAMMPGSGKLLSDDLKKEMLRQHWKIPDVDANLGYGLGFACEEIEGRSLNGHSGGMPGNITKSLFDWHEGIVISVLTNSHAGRVDMLQKAAWHILNFFKAHERGVPAYAKCKGRFYNLWRTADYIPLGNKIYVIQPDAELPFKNCEVLEHRYGNVFCITKASGYGSYGQDVEFIMEGERVSQVRFAGHIQYGEEDYQRYVGGLKMSAPS